MKIITIQKALQRKFERQKRIRKLEYHAGGHCAHLGKLSPGCFGCFVPSPFRLNIVTGSQCNLNCPYCYGKSAKEPGKRKRMKLKTLYWAASRSAHYNPLAISFSGGGEPLLYMKVIHEFMEFFRGLEKDTGKIPWYYLYTNGVLADSDRLQQLRDFGFDEIRFHLGASYFSKTVYQNVKTAVGLFKAVAVETPAWPPHRRKLLEMLPIIEDLGVKHLNLGEIEINPYNHDRIAEAFPEGKVYHYYEMHLYDGGLVYDIMEEVLRRKYSYSVLDCNCFVKSIQRSPGKYTEHEDVKGLVREYRGDRN